MVFKFDLLKRNIKLPKTAGNAIFITQRIIDADNTSAVLLKFIKSSNTTASLVPRLPINGDGINVTIMYSTQINVQRDIRDIFTLRSFSNRIN